MKLATLVASVFAIVVLSAQLALFAGAARAADSDPFAELARPGRVLLLRHANAPGVGDPQNFKLHDCRTQRNLDAAGREQAVQLGEHLRAAGIVRAKIYSSQWCRCLETARLLNLGSVHELPALNSFFDRPQDRERNLSALRDFIAGLPIDGPPVVLVTHRATIAALTGVPAASSAGGVILRLDHSRVPQVVAAIGKK